MHRVERENRGLSKCITLVKINQHIAENYAEQKTPARVSYVDRRSQRCPHKLKLGAIAGSCCQVSHRKTDFMPENATTEWYEVMIRCGIITWRRNSRRGHLAQGTIGKLKISCSARDKFQRARDVKYEDCVDKWDDMGSSHNPDVQVREDWSSGRSGTANAKSANTHEFLLRR